MAQPRIIELTEYRPSYLAKAELDQPTAETLWREHGSQIAVEEPGFKNGDRWALTSQGYVGHIPLTADLHLSLQPKAPIANVFQMLEYAYDLGQFWTDLARCQSMDEFYERLALILSKRILDRERKGLHRTYFPRQEQTPFVRGRLDGRRLSTAAWDPRLLCRYQEHTADIEDNQLLLWTLFTIARSGLCTDHARPAVRQAYHHLAQMVDLVAFSPRDCLGRLYHRLNQDYQSLHALCHFFLAGSGPTHRAGDHGMLPFLINMNDLFERFVAEWLQRHLPPGMVLSAQHHLTFEGSPWLTARPDLVLFDDATGRPLMVLDTKYKASDEPSPDDVQQVVFYAQALGCREGVLVYPRALPAELSVHVEDIRVRSASFALDGDLDAAGRGLIEALAISARP